MTRTEEPHVLDTPLLGLLTFDAALLGAFGLVFTPLYVGAVPLPMGALLSALILPWLVLRAGEIDPHAGVAGTPVLTWLLVVGVLGLTGPGDDVLLPPTWQSLVLVVGGLGTGLLAVRRVLTEEAGATGGGVRRG